MRHQGRLGHLIRAHGCAQITGWCLGGCFFGDMTEFAVLDSRAFQGFSGYAAAKAVPLPPVSLPRSDSSSHPGQHFQSSTEVLKQNTFPSSSIQTRLPLLRSEPHTGTSSSLFLSLSKNVLSTSLCHAPCRQPTHLHHRQNHFPSPNRRQNQSPHHGFTDPQDQGQEPYRRARRR